MPLSAIPPIQGVTATEYLPTVQSVQETDDSAFASVLTGAVDNVQNLHGASNELSLKAVTGDLDDIHDATIASTRASVALELVAAVRNKGVDAFNEIMRMQA